MKKIIKVNRFSKMHIQPCLAVQLIIVLAIVVTFSIYPFIATADGIKRIDIASGIDANGFSVLPPLQSLFIKYSIDITGGVGLYTTFQVTAFYAAILFTYVSLLKNILFILSFALALITISFPIFLVFPGILTDSALVFCCLAMLAALIGQIRNSKEGLRIYFLIAYIGLLIILFGMRLNAIIVLPIILILIYYYAPTFKVYAFGGMLVSICFVWLLNDSFRQQSRPEALGMAWEIIGVASAAGDDKRLKRILDFCGDTEIAISRYNTRYLNPIFWDANPPLPVNCIASVEGSKKVKGAYIRVVNEYPYQWIKTKLGIWASIYGINEPLENIRRGVHSVDDHTKKWGGRETLQQSLMLNSFFDSADWFGPVVYRPILSVFMALLSVAVVFMFFRNSFPVFVSFFALSNSYYMGFLISAQSMEFRYFAPTFYLNFMIVVAAIALSGMTFFTREKLR